MLNTDLKSLDKETWAVWGVFLGLWAYVIFKAATVFYVHDEIVTKWAYMISWNPLPYHGYVDANNHFLNSLLGGLFIRIFNSDAMVIARLPNILAFPLYFFSAYGFHRYFSKKANFYLFLSLLVLCPFVIDFFSLARGYGLSMALMLFALLQTARFLEVPKPKHCLMALAAWVLGVYTNLTLIPLALFGIVYLAAYSLKWQHPKWLIFPVIGLLPIGYAIQYAFHLKSIEKLYLGNKTDFFDVTVHDLTQKLWNIENAVVDTLLILAILFILVTTIRKLSQSIWKNVFNPKLLFPFFLLIGVLNILLQNWILGVNFPEGRAALYLVICFLGGFPLAMDYWKNRWMAFPLIALTFAMFVYKVDPNKFLINPYQFDKKLLTKIPDQVKGIPPSTGGNYLRTDNELARHAGLSLRAFQDLNNPADTLVDYFISKPDLRPGLLELYDSVYQESLSKLTLYKRKRFLPREKKTEKVHSINGTKKYFSLYGDTLDHPLFVRCKGHLRNLDMYQEAILVADVKDINKEKRYYHEGLPLVKSCKMRNGKITFDVTIAFNDYAETDKAAFYLWNRKQTNLDGQIEVSVYEVGKN